MSCLEKELRLSMNSETEEEEEEGNKAEDNEVIVELIPSSGANNAPSEDELPALPTHCCARLSDSALTASPL